MALLSKLVGANEWLWADPFQAGPNCVVFTVLRTVHPCEQRQELVAEARILQSGWQGQPHGVSQFEATSSWRSSGLKLGNNSDWRTAVAPTPFEDAAH